MGLQLSKVCSEVGDGWGAAGFMIWVRSGMTWEPKAVLEFDLVLGWGWARETLFFLTQGISGVVVTVGEGKGSIPAVSFAQELLHLTFKTMQFHTVGKRKLLSGPIPLGLALSTPTLPPTLLWEVGTYSSPLSHGAWPTWGQLLVQSPASFAGDI